MFFNKKYLTTAGKNLLDQAVAGSTITWGTCATSSLSYVNDDTARALTDIAVNGNYTSFGMVEDVVPNSENGTLTIKCTVKNHTDSNATIVSDEARAFGVWARLEDSEDSTLVAVAFWDLDEGNPETVPEYSQSSPFEATVDLYIKTSDNVISTIDSTSSWATPLSEFTAFKNDVNNDLSDLNDLKDRVVTTHSANSTSTGDTQTIKGKKTFENNIDFNGYTIFYDGIELNGDVNCQDKLYVYDTLTATDVELNNLRVADTVALSKDNRDIEPQVQIMATGNNDTEFGELTINFKPNSGGDAGGSLVLNVLDSIRLTPVTYGSIDANSYSLTVHTLTCDNLKLNDDGSRAEIADSLAGDSTYNPVGCIRLVAVQTSGPSTGDISESTYIRAGTVLSGYSVYKATFRGGDGFSLSGDETYSGSWKLLTDLAEQYGTINAWNYALAVRVL